MKRLLLAIILLLSFVFQGNAQRFDYENSSKLFFGINTGGTWHTSDVKNTTQHFPLGAGFIFGGSMNQDYGKAVSFDLRFRYLGGNWYGQDTDTTSAIQNNHAVNALYDTLGYTVQNFKSTQHRLALELAIHANRFRERTGFDPYLFAGIGITSTRTTGDLLQKTNLFSEGTIYPYNENPSGSIIDGEHNTVLDKNELGEPHQKQRFETHILPSLGFGIGYYFNSRFSVGLEHKSTFFLSDYFDGTTVNQDGKPSDQFKNDIYHYSGIYAKWYFKSSRRNYDPSTRNTYTPPTEKKPYESLVDENKGTTARTQPPVVNFSNPGTSPITTNHPVFAIRANVQFVANASALTFTHNDINHSTFIFNPMTDAFESSVPLKVGENVFTLTGVNNDGSDSDKVVIIYERKIDENKVNPPIINIVEPVFRPHTVNQLNFVLKADIQNINARNQLKVTLNDQTLTDFSFTPNGNINFNANLSLTSGVNTFKIVGTNEAGTASDEAVIIYARETHNTTGPPPTIKIITPSVYPYTTQQNIETIIAKVDHVHSKQQIEVKLNNVTTTNFTYNAATKRVQFDAHLSIGTNTVTINAVNPYGKGTDKTQLILNRSSGLPPKVNILTPNMNPYNTNQSSTKVIAEVNHVENKEQIIVLVNGVNTRDFTYNTTTQILQLTTDLILGTNTINIRATNQFGNDNDQTQVIYQRPVQEEIKESGEAPKVNILTPNVNPYNTNQSSTKVIAEVNHVENKSQIEVKINGAITSNFTYNHTTHRVQLNVNLISGNNSVNIQAKNAYGSDNDDVQIVYRRAISNTISNIGTSPSVKFLTPSTTPFTTETHTTVIVAQLQHIDRKDQIEVKINGVKTENFTYNTTLKQLQLQLNLSEGSNIVHVKASNNFGNDSAETQIILKKKPVGKPPVVSFIAPNEDGSKVTLPTFKMVAKVENVIRKNDIDLYFNGNLVNPNDYSFNSTLKTIQYESDLSYGINTYVIDVKNDFGVHQATAKIERTITVNPPKPPIEPTGINQPIRRPSHPCPSPTINITYPNNESIRTEKKEISIQGVLGNISNAGEIQTVLNGNNISSFIYNGMTNSFSHKIQLKEGENTYVVTLTNNCGTIKKELKINYAAPQTCGVKVDHGTSPTDFCLVTTSGVITKTDLLKNASFDYQGDAQSVYFKAKENGSVKVNGADFPIIKGNFYLFKGGITVDISRNKPESRGQWHICIEAAEQPVYGIGKTQPKSPCERSNNNQNNSNSIQDPGQKPIKTGKPPAGSTKPTRNPKNNRNP